MKVLVSSRSWWDWGGGGAALRALGNESITVKVTEYIIQELIQNYNQQ